MRYFLAFMLGGIAFAITLAVTSSSIDAGYDYPGKIERMIQLLEQIKHNTGCLADSHSFCPDIEK